MGYVVCFNPPKINLSIEKYYTKNTQLANQYGLKSMNSIVD